MLLFVVVLILLLWATGAFVVPVGTGLIHLLLVVALLCIIVNYLPVWRGPRE